MSEIDQKLAAIARLEAELGPHDLKVADALEELALWYADNRIYSGAVPYFRRSLEIREAKLGSDITVADALDRWAERAERKDKPEATGLFEQGLAIRQSVLGPASPDLLPALDALAEHYLRKFRVADAVSCRTRALAIAEKVHGPASREIATRLLYIGEHHLAENDLTAAEPLFRRSLAIRAELAAPDDTLVAKTLDGLIRTLAAMRQPDEIAALLQRSLRVKATLFAESPTALIKAFMATAEAVATYGHVEHLTSLLPEGPATIWPDKIRLLLHLGRQLIRKGRSAEADDVVGRAVDVLDKVLALPREDRRAVLHELLAVDHDLVEQLSRRPDPTDERLAGALGWLAANPEGISGHRPPNILE